MTTTPHDGDRAVACIEDGALLLYLDGALEGAELERADRHIDVCTACQGRLETLSARAEGFTRVLERHDPTVPDRSAYDLPARPSSRRRWAAAAVFVIAIGVTAGPARGWIASLLSSPEAPAEPDAPAATMGPNTTEFEFSLTELTITMESVSDGRIVIERSEGETVRVSHATSAAIVVAPLGIEISPASTDPGEYNVSVPASIERIVVRNTARGDTLLNLNTGSGVWTVELGSSGR